MELVAYCTTDWSMQTFLGLRSQRCQLKRIGGKPCRKANPIVLCLLLAMFPILGRTQDDKCRTKVCEEVAAVYDQTVNRSVKPCQDFYTHVCSGWMENVRKKLGSKRGRKRIGTINALLDDVIPRVVLRELKRLRNKTVEKSRDSEIQPVMFFNSCLRSMKKTNWDFNARTLRKFFYEVDLPFFDEKINYTNDDTDCPDYPMKSPLTALLKLSIQFGISPLFKVYLKNKQINIYKERHFSNERDIANEKPEDLAESWTSFLHMYTDVDSDESDPYIAVTMGALFEAYNIKAPREDVLRWGRHYEAVKYGYEQFFSQFNNVTYHRLSEWSNTANSTYLDLLDPHMGNLVQLEDDHVIVFYPSYFDPMLIMLRDRKIAAILIDFIRVHLLIEAVPDLIERTRCGLQGKECFEDVFTQDRVSGRNPVRYCAELVSAHLHR